MNQVRVTAVKFIASTMLRERDKALYIKSARWLMFMVVAYSLHERWHLHSLCLCFRDRSGWNAKQSGGKKLYQKQRQSATTAIFNWKQKLILRATLNASSLVTQKVFTRLQHRVDIQVCAFVTPALELVSWTCEMPIAQRLITHSTTSFGNGSGALNGSPDRRCLKCCWRKKEELQTKLVFHRQRKKFLQKNYETSFIIAQPSWSVGRRLSKLFWISNSRDKNSLSRRHGVAHAAEDDEKLLPKYLRFICERQPLTLMASSVKLVMTVRLLHAIRKKTKTFPSLKSVHGTW